MPIRLSYDGRNRPRAQALRREMTKQEKRLWYGFLSGYPVRFRRQKQFGYYIVDFYCAAKKLVVEIDGSQHYELEAEKRDRARTAYLESIGLRVMRFSNYNVDTQFDGVCATIDRMVRDDG